MVERYCDSYFPNYNFPGTKKDFLVVIGAILYFLMGINTFLLIKYNKYNNNKYINNNNYNNYNNNEDNYDYYNENDEDNHNHNNNQGGGGYNQNINTLTRPTNNNNNNNNNKFIVFSIFEYILYMQGIISFYTGLIIIFIGINPGDTNTFFSTYMYASAWALQHAVIEGVAFLLQQKGCGNYALKKSFLLSLIWCGLCFILYSLFFRGNNYSLLGQGLVDIILLIYYTLLTFSPTKFISPRPALKIYSKYWFIFRVIAILLHAGFIFSKGQNFCSCAYYFFRILLFCIFQPILSYQVMLIDSQWWQGISPESLQSTSRITDEFFRSNEFSLVSAQTLAEIMDHLHTIDDILFLNSNSIQFQVDVNSILGEGSFSKVVKGTYKKIPVAIKIIHTQDLTIDIITKISSEVKILSLFQSSLHVVTIFGIVLTPPAISIVLEYCYFGSLDNVIRGYEYKYQNKKLKLSNNLLKTSTIMIPSFSYNIPDMLYFALQTVKGVHTIHSTSPYLCHRDIKSVNFLVDSNLIIKIADLELGSDEIDNNDNDNDIDNNNIDNIDDNDNENCDNCDCLNLILKKKIKSNSIILQEDLITTSFNSINQFEPPSLTSSSPASIHSSINHLHPAWIAPEVLRTGRFTQSSDIYSLALVLWQIRTKKYPFDNNLNFPTKIIKLLQCGFREPLPIIQDNDPYCNILKKYDSLVIQCWNETPEMRLESDEIIQRLELLIKECGPRSIRQVYLNQLKQDNRIFNINNPLDVSIENNIDNNQDYNNNNESNNENNEYKGDKNEIDTNQKNHLIEIPSLLSSQFFQLFESHGGDWVLISLPSTNIIYRTNSWDCSIFQSDITTISKLVIDESCQKGMTFIDLISTIFYTPNKVSKTSLKVTGDRSLSASLSIFYQTCIKEGYSNIVLTDLSSIFPLLSRFLIIHGYLFDENIKSEIYQTSIISTPTKSEQKNNKIIALQFSFLSKSYYDTYQNEFGSYNMRSTSINSLSSSSTNNTNNIYLNNNNNNNNNNSNSNNNSNNNNIISMQEINKNVEESQQLLNRNNNSNNNFQNNNHNNLNNYNDNNDNNNDDSVFDTLPI